MWPTIGNAFPCLLSWQTNLTICVDTWLKLISNIIQYLWECKAVFNPKRNSFPISELWPSWRRNGKWNRITIDSKNYPKNKWTIANILEMWLVFVEHGNLNHIIDYASFNLSYSPYYLPSGIWYVLSSFAIFLVQLKTIFFIVESNSNNNP